MKGGKSKAKAPSKKDSKLATKKAVEKRSRKAVATGKGGKDPKKPKRPPSAFFVFMEQFRKEFKEKNPNNKQVSVVGKAGGDKWKSLSASVSDFILSADKLKAEYQKKMKSYDAEEAPKKASGGDETSDKSQSEVSDDAEGSDEASLEPGMGERIAAFHCDTVSSAMGDISFIIAKVDVRCHDCNWRAK